MPVCTPSTAAAPGTAATAACKCGSDFVDVAIGGFCGLKADGTGVALAKAVCATAKGNGLTDLSAAAAQCNCGSAATDATGAAKEYCRLGTGGVTGTALAEPVCTPSTAAAPGTAATAACKWGSDFVDVTTGGFCGLKADGTGVALAKAVCATAKGDGKTDLSAAAAQCNCGSATAAATGAGADAYCLLGTGGITGAKYATAQCGATTATADQATGAATVTAACQCGSTAISAADAKKCKYCYAAANYVG